MCLVLTYRRDGRPDYGHDSRPQADSRVQAHFVREDLAEMALRYHFLPQVPVARCEHAHKVMLVSLRLY